MKLKLIKSRLDVSSTIKEIRGIEKEDNLYSFSRKLRLYKDLGVIEIPNKIRTELNEQLMKIHKN